MSDNERDGTLGEVIDRRVQVYGDPVSGFAEIATMWSVLFDVDVPAWKVPIAQALMKVVRMKTSPDYSDHSDDIDGYLDIFRKIIGPDMIEARTVNEYIEKKWGPDTNYWRATGRLCTCAPRTVDPGCPQHGVAADNARQSEFYAENDRTKDAGAGEDPDRTTELDGEPIPYVPTDTCPCGRVDCGEAEHAFWPRDN